MWKNERIKNRHVIVWYQKTLYYHLSRHTSCKSLSILFLTLIQLSSIITHSCIVICSFSHLHMELTVTFVDEYIKKRGIITPLVQTKMSTKLVMLYIQWGMLRKKFVIVMVFLDSLFY